MSFDFSTLEIEGKTAKFDLPWFVWFDDGAHLVVRPANESNPGYNEAMLSLSGNRQRAVVASGKLTNLDAKRDREDDRVLYPKHILVGWSGVRYKGEAADIPFSMEAAVEFIGKLPEWVFDKLRVFCIRPENFIETEAELVPDAAETAKN